MKGYFLIFVLGSLVFLPSAWGHSCHTVAYRTALNYGGTATFVNSHDDALELARKACVEKTLTLKAYNATREQFGNASFSIVPNTHREAIEVAEAVQRGTIELGDYKYTRFNMNWGQYENNHKQAMEVAIAVKKGEIKLADYKHVRANGNGFSTKTGSHERAMSVAKQSRGKAAGLVSAAASVKSNAPEGAGTSNAETILLSPSLEADSAAKVEKGLAPETRGVAIELSE